MLANNVRDAFRQWMALGFNASMDEVELVAPQTKVHQGSHERILA